MNGLSIGIDTYWGMGADYKETTMLLVMWQSLVGGGSVICESRKGVETLKSIIGSYTYCVTLEPHFDESEGSTCWYTPSGYVYHGGEDHNTFLARIRKSETEYAMAEWLANEQDKRSRQALVMEDWLQAQIDQKNFWS
jgi:hypothetical protein